LLTSYGWNETLQHAFEPYAAQGLSPGRIVVQQRGGYRLITEQGEVDARASGALMRATTDEGHPHLCDASNATWRRPMRAAPSPSLC